MICESYGLVFGTNSFIALIMQSLLTAIVSDKRCLGLPVRQQYVVYSILHMVIAVIFLCSVIFTVITYCFTYASRKNKVKDEKSFVSDYPKEQFDDQQSNSNDSSDIEQDYNTVESQKSSNGTASTDDKSNCSGSEEEEKNATKIVNIFSCKLF